MSPPATPAATAHARPASEADAATPVAWPVPERQGRFEAWLSSLAPRYGLLLPSLRLATADASFRRYLRLDSAAGSSYIVMDAPPEKENCEPFVRIGKLMAAAGVRVPALFEWNQADGFVLLEDLGSRSMIDALDTEQTQANQALFVQALEPLLAWQLASKPSVLPPYDHALLMRELQLFPDWYLERHRTITLDAGQRTSMHAMFERIVQHNLAGPSVYVHRDFMPRNLMLAPASSGSNATLAVLDFQDAVYGPISYDMASLMRDAFISWDEEFVLDISVRYWQKARAAGLPVDADFSDFYRAIEWMGLQRHLKVAGIFARLSLRDGKPKYLADTPRFIAYIRATCARYRELGPLLRLLDQVEGVQAATGYAFGRV